MRTKHSRTGQTSGIYLLIVLLFSTAVVADVTAIVYVRGKCPGEAGIELARQGHLPLLRTPLTMYEACGRLYGAGLPGCKLERREEQGPDERHT